MRKILEELKIGQRIKIIYSTDYYLCLNDNVAGTVFYVHLLKIDTDKFEISYDAREDYDFIFIDGSHCSSKDICITKSNRIINIKEAYEIIGDYEAGSWNDRKIIKQELRLDIGIIDEDTDGNDEDWVSMSTDYGKLYKILLVKNLKKFLTSIEYCDTIHDSVASSIIDDGKYYLSKSYLLENQFEYPSYTITDDMGEIVQEFSQEVKMYNHIVNNKSLFLQWALILDNNESTKISVTIYEECQEAHYEGKKYMDSLSLEERENQKINVELIEWANEKQSFTIDKSELDEIVYRETWDFVLC